MSPAGESPRAYLWVALACSALLAQDPAEILRQTAAAHQDLGSYQFTGTISTQPLGTPYLFQAYECR